MTFHPEVTFVVNSWISVNHVPKVILHNLYKVFLLGMISFSVV